MRRLLWSVSLPRMREHRLRTLLTALGIALGVAVVVSVVLVSRSIVDGVTQTLDDIAGKADLQISASSSGFAESLLDTVREVPGVYKLTPVLQQIVPLHTRDGRRERLLLLGVDLLGNDDAYFRQYGSQELEDIRRDSLSFLNSTSNLILSRDVATRLGLKLHDQVSLATGHGIESFEIWGFIDSPTLGRAFGGAVGVMYYPAMQVAFERGRNIDRIDVAVKPGSDAEPVARALEAALGSGMTVDRPTMRGDRVSKLLIAVRTALSMACLVALLAGSFLVFSTISISIVQRKRELGVLRALGTTRGQLLSLLTFEGALLGLVGSTLGVLLGLGLAQGMLRVTSRAVDQVYMQQSVRDVHLDPWLVLLGFALGLGAAVSAAWLAARRTASLRPTEVLSSSIGVAAGVRSDASRFNRVDALALGLFVLALGLANLPPVELLPIGPLVAVMVLMLASRASMPRVVLAVQWGLRRMRRWLGAEASLASDNLPRDLSRTASTASGLMASAALTISTATFIVSFVSSLGTWSDQTVPGDLFVTSGASVAGFSARNIPMADSMRGELLGIEGVERVRRTSFADASYRGAPIKILATDMNEFVKRSHFTAFEGDAEQIVRDMFSGKVAVSENFSRLHDVHRGDRITLGTHDGTREFSVAGVILDYTSDRGTVVLDRATYIAAWSDTRVDTFEVHLKPGATPEQVRARINDRLGANHDLFVLTNAEFRGEILRAIDGIFSLMRVLELVTLLVAALGMLTSVLANVLDRVREIGVLRAIGMLRKQVRKLVVIESTFIGVAGAIAGTFVGVALGYLLLRRIATVQMGWYLPYHLPVRAIAEFAAITLPVSALAGLFPAREAARLQIRDALDYE
jgi:putative ABC transport system permease protein